MPNYKVVDADVLDADLTAVADAIRTKTGGTDPMTLDEMAVAVEGIQTGGGSGGDDSQLDAVLDGSITEIGSDTLTFLRFSAFNNCKSLISADFPKVTSSDGLVFSSCVSLKFVNLPALEVVNGTNFLNGCKELEIVEFPRLTTAGTDFLYGCEKLKRVDLGNLSGLKNYFFTNCKELSVIILRADSVAQLNSANPFVSTPFASGGTGGTVYCPAALIEQYQQATNWSALYAAGTCNFVAIEGSEYE